PRFRIRCGAPGRSSTTILRTVLRRSLRGGPPSTQAAPARPTCSCRSPPPRPYAGLPALPVPPRPPPHGVRARKRLRDHFTRRPGDGAEPVHFRLELGVLFRQGDEPGLQILSPHSPGLYFIVSARQRLAQRSFHKPSPFFRPSKDPMNLSPDPGVLSRGTHSSRLFVRRVYAAWLPCFTLDRVRLV